MSFNDYYWHQFDVLNKDTQLARQFGQDVWDYKQAEIEELKKQRDSFIKAHHISMNDVCEHKAKIDELQRKIAFQEKAIKNIKLQFENKQIDCDRSDRKIDELKKRIDETLMYLRHVDSRDYQENIIAKILKGNKNEN